MFSISDLWVLHGLQDFLNLCFWAVWMIYLYSTISSSKSIFGIVVITSSSFSSCCSWWTSGTSYLTGCVAAAFLCGVFLLVLRLVSVAVLWLLCLPLAMLFSCLPLALLFSVLFIFAADLRVLLAVLVPLLHLLRSSHHWLVGCGSFCASSSELLCGRLRLRGSFLASSNITTQRCALRD